MKFKKPREEKVPARKGDELRKERRDRIAREAERVRIRDFQNEVRAKEMRAKYDEAKDLIRQGVRIHFDFRNGFEYPCVGRLTDVLDMVRLAFFDLQKEHGICGHREDDWQWAEDPEFGTQGNHAARGRDEQDAEEAWRQRKGPIPPFLVMLPCKRPQDAE